MSTPKDRWFEVWFDPGSDILPAYLLIVTPDPANPGGVLVCDPSKNNRVVYEGANYERTCIWLSEDEYELVEGRMFVDDIFPLPTKKNS